MADPNKLPTIWDDPFGTLSPSAGTQEVFGALADALSGVKRQQAAMHPWQHTARRWTWLKRMTQHLTPGISARWLPLWAEACWQPLA